MIKRVACDGLHVGVLVGWIVELWLKDRSRVFYSVAPPIEVDVQTNQQYELEIHVVHRNVITQLQIVL